MGRKLKYTDYSLKPNNSNNNFKYILVHEHWLLKCPRIIRLYKYLYNSNTDDGCSSLELGKTDLFLIVGAEAKRFSEFLIW